MNLTKIQREAVKYDDNSLIRACPGSGKTRTLIAKLLHDLDKVRDTSRKIVCLTYTNAAVHEIEGRLRKYGKNGDEEYCDISTIHSFCLVNILNNFYWYIPEYSNGFKVITPESEDYQKIAIEVLEEYGLSPRLDSFELIDRELDGAPITSSIDHAIVLAFWKRLQDHGYIDFPNIIYYAVRLLSDKPSIAYALSCKYAWFLVDEFQDTTALQVEIFRKIASFGHTKFFLVGDPFQSIYGFAGARVELMEAFAKEISAKMDFKLLTNYRSSKTIIDHAELLCSRNPCMYGLESANHSGIEPIYVHASTAFEAITDYFLPKIESLGISYGDAVILAPWWIKLLHLGRNLREYGIPIVGPGARPYKKSHLFSTIAEQLCAYAAHPTNQTFHQIEKELFFLINNITGKRPYFIFSYKGNVTIRKLIEAANEIYKKNHRAVEWLILVADIFERILVEDELITSTHKNILNQSVISIIDDMKKNRVDLSNIVDPLVKTKKQGVFSGSYNLPLF